MAGARAATLDPEMKAMVEAFKQPRLAPVLLKPVC